MIPIKSLFTAEPAEVAASAFSALKKPKKDPGEKFHRGLLRVCILFQKLHFHYLRRLGPFGPVGDLEFDFLAFR